MVNPDVAAPLDQYDIDVGTLIIGAGAAGMIAALTAHEAGQDVLLIEADPLPSGSTALSAGLIPAAGTRFQAQAGILDSPSLFSEDIQRKAKGENEQALVDTLATKAAEVIEWLADKHRFEFSVITDFEYPGHSRRRMHGLPSRAGSEFVDTLRERVEALDIPLICNRRAFRIFAQDSTVRGVEVIRPDGGRETIGAERIILACNGFGGNRQMVSRYMPEIDQGLWFGHDGNQGEAVAWAQALGAATRHLGAYQGHGNVAHPHGILITWAVITEGGIQVNTTGQRFWNEAQGYSEAAREVLRQPKGRAWAIFDKRIAGIARQFADFKSAETQGAVVSAQSIEELERLCQFPAGNLRQTLDGLPRTATDEFGRDWGDSTLSPPFCAVRVTGALFHTQGGLDIDPATACVRKQDGGVFSNLFAAGGASCGVSGTGDAGYLSGNGLLSACVLGRLSGRS